ncbi:GRIP and coiled-coil domain-containing protein 2 185 kDa Golgi coiled-coil protein [Channa argus]|uniref:GRIP and coiled-coil domain-containing protein 2 185 kDa Golgi coiled-coil protein n=1 Tax=Channa argus TaxID=215402 RepID=A0A6G1PYG4_CHAAH|nr:GRIP and coiled-coil domain-containing protein 2 185 kDa Golgi coiled-coil protein [Channa argus]
MEDPGGTGVQESAAPSPAGATKSKLDTLSKDDLIKFAKKQMAAMQKIKGRCADLEKEVEFFKQQSQNSNISPDDSTLIQELTERMDALLLEKAETQQSLALSRKDLEKTKQQSKDDLAVLQAQLTVMTEDHQRKIKTLELSIEESNTKHQEELAHFQKLLKEQEDSNRDIEKERKAEHTCAKESAEECRSFKAQLESIQAELEAIQEKKSQEIADLQESHQKELTKAQQEVENLKEELVQKSLQHEEEMRALEEDCEIERERLLLLHEELTEQLALKDSYLQDVQEEDEEPARSSGIAKMLELSGFRQGESSHIEEVKSETGRLRAALEDFQAQNTMLQDELTLISNVKEELEAELERVKEEFQMEREEMEFKINELQMTRESAPTDPVMTLNLDEQDVQAESKESQASPIQDQNSLNTVELQKVNQELKAQCKTLTGERDSALADCQHMRDILQGLGTELSEKTNDFVLQYQTMKEQAANTVRELQEKIDHLSHERDELLGKEKLFLEEKNNLMEKMKDLKLKLEGSTDDDQKLRLSVDEQTTLTCELKQSVEELTKQNEEILSQLQMSENQTENLQEIVSTLTEGRDKLQSLLKLQGEEMQKLNNERAKEFQRLLEEKEKEVLLLREEKDKELKRMRKEKEEEVQHLKEERDSIKENMKEEAERRQGTISALELTVKELSTEKTDLHHKLEEISSELSKAQEERRTLSFKLADLEAQLKQNMSEKDHLEAKLNSVKEEAEQAHISKKALEKNLSEVLKKTSEEVEELRSHVDDLEKQRTLLSSSLEEAQGEEVRNELQAYIIDLEQERNMMRNNLEEVVKDTEGLQKDLQDMKSVCEKISNENHKLQAQISMMTQEKEDKEREMKGMEEEREIREQLTEKDKLISQLRSEMAALKDSVDQSASSEEKAANEITKRIALLEKENKEKDERMNKIKAVAVKAKKELDIHKKEVATLKDKVESLKAEREKTNSSMKDIIHGAEGYKNLQIGYDKQTEQLDKEREKVEAAERQIAELTKRLSSAVTQNDTLISEKEDLLARMETIRNTVRQLESQNQELQKISASLERDLIAERAMKEQKTKDLSSAMKEVEELTAQLRKQQQQSQQTAQELEQLRKEAQQSSLLDMEMADYERLVKELDTKISEKDKCAEELKAQINTLSQKEETLKQEIEVLKSQLDQGEEKISKMKQLLVRTKKDLADAKKQESSFMMLQASLKGELEANQQQLESSKIEVCELTAERHRLQEQLRSALEQQQRTSNSLQQCINSLEQERDTAKAELAATTGEFESYKIRVHNVLKQQKSKTTAQTEVDSGKLEREHLSSKVEQLRTRLAENQQSLQSTTAELQQLQTEHDTLLERHNKILQETVSKEVELRERLLSLQSENVALRSDLTQAQADLSSQVEIQRQTYREQLRKLQDDHRATVETLQGQLTRVEEQLFNLQSQNNAVSVQSSRKPLSLDLQRRSTDQMPAGLGLVALSDLQSMDREEGEGMETTETENLSPALTPLPSLEKLLTSPDPKQEPFVWTVEPTKDELIQKLTTATRSMEHMNSLLHETEATNAVLMEQITLLKSEVRRLERNQEREKSVANLEYLKNVLLQFIFLRSGSERQALLPVIHTMLQLSPDEKSKLAAIAQGEEEGSGSRGSGWTSYLHSWSGIR